MENSNQTIVKGSTVIVDRNRDAEVIIANNPDSFYVKFSDSGYCEWINTSTHDIELIQTENSVFVPEDNETGIEVTEPTRTFFAQHERVYIGGKSATVLHENGELITVKFIATGEVVEVDYTEITGFIPNYDAREDLGDRVEATRNRVNNNETENSKIMTTLEKNQEILEKLRELKNTGKVVIEMQNIVKTGYGFGNIEEAIRYQVQIEKVHTLCDGAEEERETELRVRMIIIAKDSLSSINTKIGYVNEKLEEIALQEKRARFEKNSQSDNLFDFLEANFELEKLN